MFHRMNPRVLSRLLGLLAVSGLILAGCATPTPAPATAVPTTEVTEAATEAATEMAGEATDASPTEEAAMAEISYANDIQPLLTSRCLGCHGGERTQAGLDMNSYDSLLAGSSDGAVVIPGEAANSLIVQMVESGKMPKRGPKLTPEQVQLIVAWINAGAPNN